MRAVGLLLGGVVGAFLGFAAAAIGSYLIMGMSGVSDFEGERAMTAFWLFGPIGGLAGIVIGSWLALRLTSGQAGAASVALWSGASLAGLAALGAAAFGIAWLSVDRPINPNGPAPRLAFEIRIPVAIELAEYGSSARVLLDTDLNQMPAVLVGPRREGEWIVLAGDVDLYYRTSRRLVVLDFGDGKQQLFDPRLAAAPSASPDWSQWRRVDFVYTSPEQVEAARPGLGDLSEMRTRVIAF